MGNNYLDFKLGDTFLNGVQVPGFCCKSIWRNAEIYSDTNCSWNSTCSTLVVLLMTHYIKGKMAKHPICHWWHFKNTDKKYY